ncbi:MAG: hypothetical protein H6818_14185 [Phycisphaerales bacterium]|nr:hypothetical protein [Phycisphaerales bacterium]MCB9862047.1 hypothetical protein [Phycisphaerales bacterium]
MNTKTPTNLDLAFARESNSSVFKRIDASLRREINIAIVERRPATIKEVHEQFQLQDQGIGYHAFYRYARRIRAEASLIETAAAMPDPDNNVPRLITRALAQGLLELLAFEEASPRKIQRLTEAYRASVTALAVITRFNLLPRNSRKDAAEHTDDLAAMVRELRELAQREDNQLADAITANIDDNSAAGARTPSRTRSPSAGARSPSRTHPPSAALKISSKLRLSTRLGIQGS